MSPTLLPCSVTQLGFVARLGQPGAAAKFQNLHLVDVKRRGGTDVHFVLGDLAFVRAKAAEASSKPGIAADASAAVPQAVTAACGPSTCGGSGAALVSAGSSPVLSDMGNPTITEPCILAGGAAEGGVVSGASSEGTTGATAGTVCASATATTVPVASSAAAHASTAAEADASTDTRSQQADAPCGDTDDKGTGTSAAASAPTAGAAAPDTAASPVLLSFQCGCSFCPCHFDEEQANGASTDRPFELTPYNSAVADHQVRREQPCVGLWVGL